MLRVEAVVINNTIGVGGCGQSRHQQRNASFISREIFSISKISKIEGFDNLEFGSMHVAWRG